MHMDPSCSSKTAWLKKNASFSGSFDSLCTGEQASAQLHLHDSCLRGHVITLCCLFGLFRGKGLKIHLPWGTKRWWQSFPLHDVISSFPKDPMEDLPWGIAHTEEGKEADLQELVLLMKTFNDTFWLHHSKIWQKSNESVSYISVWRQNSHRDLKEKSRSPHWPWM